MRFGVSVVICTYNGAALLPETLRHIAQQRVRLDIDWELLVVNNACTDNTSEVVIAEWQKHNQPTKLSLLYQPRQGLTYARKLALEKANYEFVLFCDDDNWLDAAYVNKAYDLMKQHPEIGVLGGNGELVFESLPPEWALGHGFFANGPQAATSGSVRRKFVYGAGSVIRKSAYEVLLHAGFKPLLTDRIGGKLSSGGDYELCYAIALAGYEIWYDEGLKFRHFMSKGRLEWDYLVRFIKEGVKCFEVVIPYRICVTHNNKTSLSFNLRYLQFTLSYISKLLPLLLMQAISPAGSEAAKRNTIKIISLKSKIQCFRDYRTMRQNFFKVFEFQQRNLLQVKNNEKINVNKTLINKTIARKIF
jgi:glycosyltransferase involved in cell wall biosynthesis